MKSRFLREFGLARRTRKTHQAAYASWKRYWEQRQEVPRMDEKHLTDYMFNELLRGRKISGISTYLGGIGATMVDRNEISEEQWRSIVESRAVRSLKKAAAKREIVLGHTIRQSSAITEQELRKLCNTVRNFDDQAIASAAITAFYNLHRGSELILTDSSDSSLKRPFSGDIKITDSTITYRIRSEKQRQYKATPLCLEKDSLPSWAFTLWKTYWDDRTGSKVRGHPDVFVKGNGKVVTATDLNLFLNRGPRKLSMHSLRAGGATNMLLKGATMIQLCAKGRWSSEQSLLRYLRVESNEKELHEEAKVFWKKKEWSKVQ